MGSRLGLTSLVTLDRYSVVAAPTNATDPAPRRSSALRRSLLRRFSTLRCATRRSPAPCAALTRLSARALRSAALRSNPARLPTDLLSSTVSSLSFQLELLGLLGRNRENPRELERCL